MATSLIVSIIVMAGISLLVTNNNIPGALNDIFFFFNKSLQALLGVTQ